jgi:hypothetical protein
VLTVQGFGIILPAQVRVCRELGAADPDLERVSQYGLRAARLAGVQGALQLLVVYVMVNVRF